MPQTGGNINSYYNFAKTCTSTYNTKIDYADLALAVLSWSCSAIKKAKDGNI